MRAYLQTLVVIALLLQHLGHLAEQPGSFNFFVSQNIVNIAFHNKSWAAFGCQIIFRWSSAEQRTKERPFGSQRLPRICCGF